jgi:predicted alpha/beta hydrolase family esterase
MAPLPHRVLLLPGWLDSGADHWQSRWERLHGYRRVEQDDWLWPRRGDWMARLDEVLLEHDSPAVLVAHSLGCLLVAAWAGHSQHVARVRAALLVAPPDTERGDMPPNLFNWKPIERRRLPFAAHLVSSDNDPFCAPERAARLTAEWGCTQTTLGARGHINAESGLGDWPEGHALLQSLLRGQASPSA